MEHDDVQPEKRPWRTPEMVDVGGALDLTQAVGGNVRDSPSDPPNYAPNTRTCDMAAEVDFEDS